jgi:hypothetical protein
MRTSQDGFKDDRCQRRLKNPHFAGRKFPSPGEVVVYSFSRWVEDGNRLAKRRWALLRNTLDGYEAETEFFGLYV